MRLVLENIDDVIGRQIALSAAEHNRTIEEEAVFVLKEKFSEFSVPEQILHDIRKKSGNPLEKFQMIQEIFLEKRGGIEFSDSAQIIRESRDNDLVSSCGTPKALAQDL